MNHLKTVTILTSWQSDMDQCCSSARLIYIPVWPSQRQPKYSGVCKCAECIPSWFAVISVMVMLECEVLFFPIIVCIEDGLATIASLVYYCAVLMRLGGGGWYKLPGPKAHLWCTCFCLSQ